MSDELAEVLEKFPMLTEREAAAFRFVVMHNRPLVSPTLSAQLYTLFLQGKGCVEIAELNKGLTLGEIVRCRIDQDWDVKRQEYIDSLLGQISTKMVQCELEVRNHLMDMLAVNHRLYGQKIAKFLQNGNVEELQGVPVGSFKQYREIVQLLKELAGDGVQKVTVNVNNHSTEKGKVVEGESKVVEGSLLSELAKKARE